MTSISGVTLWILVCHWHNFHDISMHFDMLCFMFFRQLKNICFIGLDFRDIKGSTTFFVWNFWIAFAFSSWDDFLKLKLKISILESQFRKSGDAKMQVATLVRRTQNMWKMDSKITLMWLQIDLNLTQTRLLNVTALWLKCDCIVIQKWLKCD